jgi:hypothetical protein
MRNRLQFRMVSTYSNNLPRQHRIFCFAYFSLHCTVSGFKRTHDIPSSDIYGATRKPQLVQSITFKLLLYPLTHNWHVRDFIRDHSRTNWYSYPVLSTTTPDYISTYPTGNRFLLKRVVSFMPYTECQSRNRNNRLNSLNENSYKIGLKSRSISDVDNNKDTQTMDTEYTLQTYYASDTARCLEYSYAILNYSEGRWFDSRWCQWNFSLT